jgi:hypothetical protein
MNYALDIAIVIVMLAFLGYGFTRNPIRELIATAGIILGALVAYEWVGPWGNDFANFAGFLALDKPTSELIVSYGLFLGSVVIVGYGLTFLLPAPRPVKFFWRPVSAVLGLFNASLIVGYLARFAQIYYYNRASGSPLVQSYTAWALMNWVGLVFVGIVILLVPAIAGAVIFRVLTTKKEVKPVTAAPGKPGTAAPVKPREPIPATARPIGMTPGPDLATSRPPSQPANGLKETKN